MKDGIIKGTGNSRYLKSSVPAGTTWEQVLTMLRNGTFPIDFNGINENGWQQLATALNKANLLSDSTKNSIGLTQSDPTVNDALYKLRSLITTAQSTATGRAQIQVGSYVGTGTYGASNPNSITCSFAPEALILTGPGVNSENLTIVLLKEQTSSIEYGAYNSSYLSISNVTWTTTAIEWYSSNEREQANQKNKTYRYLILG